MNYKFKTKPYKHQMTALEKSWNRETYAYFMEMGTGKTKVLIDNLAMLYDKGKVNGALIIAPKGVVGTWYNNELPTHLPNHIENITVLWKAAITKKQKENLDELFSEGEGLHILIFGLPSRVPAISCITYTVGFLIFSSFMIDNIVIDGYIVN